MCLLRSFIRKGFCPTLIRNGRQILLMELKDLEIRFITSNSYFNCNEYSLANQYEIEYNKTFFPLKFCKIENFSYQGNVPTVNYFLSTLDDSKTMEAKMKFHQKLQTELRSKWNFQKELLAFCEQKVWLLTLACIKFISDCFEFQQQLKVWNLSTTSLLHPFSFPLCSLGGFVYKLFKVLVLNDINVYAVNNEFGIGSKSVSKVEYEWASFMAHKYPEKEFISAFNNPLGQKYFKEAIPDLYSPITKEAFFMHGCIFHGHYDNCLINPTATKNSINPFGKSFFELEKEFQTKGEALLTNNPTTVSDITICWECKYKNTIDIEKQIFLERHFVPHPLYRLKPRTCVRGAYFDIARLFWSKELFPNENMYFLDVNGLYSYCAINFEYMIGKSKILIGPDISKITINNNKFYFENRRICGGSILITILPPQNLLLPFLPYRKRNGKTVNTLCVMCAEKELKLCTHTNLERALTSSYMISEIEFALQLNYQILHIHECHIYEESSFILKDFIKAINFFKTKYSDFLSKADSQVKKEEICNQLNFDMELSHPFVLTTETNLPNLAKKTFYKLMANALFGKFEQKNNKSQTLFLNKQSDIEDIYFSENKIEDIFCLNEEICQVQVVRNTNKIPPNRRTNCYLGAQITAFARQVIYEHVQTLINSNATIYQIDCDSIIFTLNQNQQIPLKVSSAVGHFKHEINDIISFYSLGPKNYSLTFQTTNGIETLSRVRGISLNNLLNKVTLDNELFKFYVSQFLKRKPQQILMKQFRKKADFKNLKICSQIEQITFTNDLSKRRNVDFSTKNFLTLPYGYKRSEM